MLPKTYRKSDGQIVRVERNFWSKVRKTSTCWVWVACKHSFGYGVFRCKTVLYRAHRISWEWEKGKIPRDKCVLHKCDNPACVRPSHLFLGTKLENTQDMIRKGRDVQDPARGEDCARKLTWRRVRSIRRKYATGEFTQAELAQEFGVSQPMVGYIVRHEQWKVRSRAALRRSTKV
jgi:HNH endonuclease